jgi:hypothetical protein
LVQEVLEGHRLQARLIERGKFLPEKRPGHLPFRITRLATAANDKQRAARAGKCAESLDRSGSQRG